MSQFTCSECGAQFSVPAAALAKYPGWTPKFCRLHKQGGGQSKRPRKRPAGGAPEKHLNLAQVLERHRGGPSSGVFTDGSAIPNPGRGGWGVVWVEGGEVREERYGKEAHTTNNRMELRALIEAYSMLPEDAALRVYTDSRLCVDTITKWAPAWKRKGWRKKSGEIKNLALVQELFALHAAHPAAELCWIAAHSGNRWNEYADSLATAWMRDEL